MDRRRVEYGVGGRVKWLSYVPKTNESIIAYGDRGEWALGRSPCGYWVPKSDTIGNG